MTSYGEAREMRRGHSRPGHHPSGAWRWSLESGLRSKDSRAVRRRVVGKVPIEATRWRPILLQARFGEGDTPYPQGSTVPTLLKDRIRLWKGGVRDLVMELCCALHNFRVRLTP